MREGLTARQAELFDFLKSVHKKTGLMPSTREIQTHFGFSSQTAAMGHLRALEKKGHIRRIPGQARAIIFTEQSDSNPFHKPQAQTQNIAETPVVKIPLYGSIAAGFAQDSQPQLENELSLDPILFGLADKNNLFALKVKGESMINASICDGDIIILEKRMPRNGDIVAALIDGETTLKRYIESDGKTYLKAENPAFPDLHPVQELQVQGVLITLIRDRF